MITAYVPPVGALPLIDPLSAPTLQGAATSHPTSFSRMVTNGIDSLNTKLAQADAEVKAFTLDDSIPVHQVTFALEQARQSLELMLQMRARLIEGYQQLMNMQL